MRKVLGENNTRTGHIERTLAYKTCKLGPETQYGPLLALCPGIDLSRPQSVSLSFVCLERISERGLPDVENPALIFEVPMSRDFLWH